MIVQFSALDSISEEQIAILVDTFYSHVRQDGVLGPVFEKAVGDDP